MSLIISASLSLLHVVKNYIYVIFGDIYLELFKVKLTYIVGK